MELRVLRYFLETAREGNMTRAAERLYISQPTMSKQLKELEQELGAKLFVRSNYSIRLTEAGMLLRDRAEDILSLVEKTEAEFKSLEEVNSGDLFIGAPESEAMGLFAELIRDLQSTYPKIRCNIYSGNLSDVCERLDKGLLDFAIVMSYVDPSKYNCLTLPMKDRWGVLMRKDDPLAQRESFEVSDLYGLPLICSRQWIDQEAPQWFCAAAKEEHHAETCSIRKGRHRKIDHDLQYGSRYERDGSACHADRLRPEGGFDRCTPSGRQAYHRP